MPHSAVADSEAQLQLKSCKGGGSVALFKERSLPLG